MVVEEVIITLSGGAPWGFRLQGGVEHQKPLQVAKVRKRSKACRAGLREADELVSINEQSCGSLSHAQAMELIDSSPGILHIRVKRVPAGFQSVVLVTRAPSPRIDKEYRAALRAMSPNHHHHAPVREVHRSRSSLTSGLTSPPGSEAYYGETDSDADVAGYERQRRQKRRSPSNSTPGKPTGRASPEGGETSEMSGYDSAPDAQAFPRLLDGRGGDEEGGGVLPGVARREVIYQPPGPGMWSSQTSTETSSIISSADDQGPRDGGQEEDSGFLEPANVPLVSPERAKEALMLGSRDQLVPMVGPINKPIDEELTTTYMEKAKQAKLNRGDTQQDKHVKEAKSKCRTIASLLTDAPNPHSKGVLMFKKRRQRSKKYTLTSFGSVDEDMCQDSQEEDGVLPGSESEFDEDGFSAVPDPTWDSDYLDMLEKRATAGTEGRVDQTEDVPSTGLSDMSGKGAQLFEQQRKRAAEHAKKVEAAQPQAAPQAPQEPSVISHMQQEMQPHLNLQPQQIIPPGPLATQQEPSQGPGPGPVHGMSWGRSLLCSEYSSHVDPVAPVAPLPPPQVPVAQPPPPQFTPGFAVPIVSQPEVVSPTPVSGPGGRTGILTEARRRGGKPTPMFKVPDVTKKSPNPELLSMVQNLDDRSSRYKYGQPPDEVIYDGAEEERSGDVGMGKAPPPVAPKPRVIHDAPKFLQAGGKGAELFARRQSRMGMYVVDTPPETPYQQEVSAHSVAQPLDYSSNPSFPSQWKYSPNVRAPPPIGYNPLLSPSIPLGPQRDISKPDTKGRGGTQREGIKAIDFMRRQPYQLNSAMFNYGGSAANLSAMPSYQAQRQQHGDYTTTMVGSSLTSPKQIPVKTARVFEVKRFSTPTPMSASTLAPKVIAPRSATTLGERLNGSDMTSPPPAPFVPTPAPFSAPTPAAPPPQPTGLPSLPKFSSTPIPNPVPHTVPTPYTPSPYPPGLQAAKQFQSAPELSILSSLPPLKSNPIQAPKPRFVATKGGVQPRVWRPGAM
ncbi:uncharacterized protein V6R79_015505 [Siganus canaliculatus]